MKHLFLILISVIGLISCDKNNDTDKSCFFEFATTRTVANKPATVRLRNNEYYIIERGSIDAILFPCSLADEFKIDGLAVIVSGNVKNTLPIGPCCVENFVIRKITK